MCHTGAQVLLAPGARRRSDFGEERALVGGRAEQDVDARAGGRLIAWGVRQASRVERRQSAAARAAELGARECAFVQRTELLCRQGAQRIGVKTRAARRLG